MRHLVYGILAGLVLAMPAAAQSGSAANTAPSKTSQDQGTKDSRVANEPAKPASQAAPASRAAPVSQAPPAAKDNSLSNYDVNGSNASDAMGASR